jgi:hypothetical protein
MTPQPPEGFEPTTMTETAAPTEASFFAPSDFDAMADALPELKNVPGISAEWLEWCEGFTYRLGLATGVIEPPEPGAE